MDACTCSLVRSPCCKLNLNELILTTVDKRNTVVMMEKTKYESKFEDFLNDSHYALSSIGSPFILSEHVKEVRSVMNKSPPLTKNPDHLFSPNPASPRLVYGLPKLHKLNTLIRLIPSFNSAPAYMPWPNSWTNGSNRSDAVPNLVEKTLVTHNFISTKLFRLLPTLRT